ncbi:mRNA-capping enzyme subunit beta [Apophysomyces sp. BC1034]|nr:mRNA-capping enzyme subunit beta [Apophysomyces sp. BC1015]KAG0173645.1 mRNA-capping enzyme subunit beta [Apophysomyces sp. BC1021]KAG0185600.1 mRNA-capping enzyme subunit beta [Apophysomyces sp. BC1034]
MAQSQNGKRPQEDTDEGTVSKRRNITIPREPSIFNVKPVDDITKYISDFLWDHCGTENVEIEAKLGVFIDKKTDQRINLMACTETIIPHHLERSFRFDADMPLRQHQHFNKLLNEQVNRTQARDYKGDRIKYKHTKEVDHFYQVGNAKYRVTTDQKTGQIVPNGIIEKVRVANLNIHSPMRSLDYRISVNIEKPRNKPTSTPTMEREKDRMSYQHGWFNFDLTQVKTNGDRAPKVTHELELELVDAGQLAFEKAKSERKENSQYVHMIEVFVNNIRMLGRSAQ